LKANIRDFLLVINR